jgi:hypothetical protein
LPVWVEASGRDKWASFVKEEFDLPAHSDRSNWYDTFRYSVDLKPLVFRRLVQLFPDYAGSLALRPERLVRITFSHQLTVNDQISGLFRNIGPGPALNLVHGIAPQGSTKWNFGGGVREGDPVASGINGYFLYRVANVPFLNLFCEYENRFGDGYRVEVPVTFDNGTAIVGKERFLIRHGGRSNPDWIAASKS